MRALVRSTLVRVGLREPPKPPKPPIRLSTAEEIIAVGLRKAHYGAGATLLDGWVNIDLGEIEAANYLKADVTQRHPFPDGWFRCAFAEDFLEHLDQEQSLRFLIEVHRTLQPGGVLRLSFPGLEGVLRKHYSPPTLDTAQLAASEAYSMWGHRHFYSREELATAARHIGFGAVREALFGQSEHPELRGLDSRADPVNTIVEVVK